MEIIKTKNDFYTSVERAFDEIDGNWKKYKGLVVVGSHFPEDIEKKIEKIEEARQKNIPFLGICFGMQLAVIEYARNVLKDPTATSQEFGQGTYFITKLPKLRVGIRDVKGAYGSIPESHWHNYAVNKELVGKLIDGGLSITEWGDSDVVERIELKSHPHFVGVQYHPEYNSTIDKPHRLLTKFIETCKK